MQPTAKAGTARHIKVLYVIIYGTMFIFGLVENIKSVSFPLIKSEFGVAYDSQGGLVSMTWFGYVIFCLVASLFLQRFGQKRAVTAGYLLIVAGSLATLAAPSFWAASLALLVVNAGFGFFEVGANALATVVFTRRAALMMNLMHFFYGFGAIAGPKAAGLLTGNLGLGWRQVYLTMLVPTVLFLLFILLTRFNGQQQGAAASAAAPSTTPRLTLLGALRRPVVWLFIFTLGFMEVVEFGAANWGGLYLKDVYGLDPRTTGASFVSLFYILFTLSRLLSGLAIERITYVKSLFIATFGVMVLYAAGFGLGERGIWLLPFTGFFIGVMWPTTIAVAMRVFGADAPICTSAIITLSGAVNGVFQLVIGLTNYYAGDAWGYRSCLLYACVILVMLSALALRLRRQETEGEPAAA